MLLMKDIIRDGHPTLRKEAKEVAIPPSTEDKLILQRMQHFLKNSQDPNISEKYGLRAGVGLAAPQINCLKRMFVMRLTDEKGKEHHYSWINPTIVSHSIEKTYLTSGEGCLSVDESIPGYVPRYARITVKGYNEEGEEVKLRLRGLPAIVFQHELDHLDGILFYDHIDAKHPFHIPENATPIES